ncbi:hypothetical protein L0128_04535, partial [candidate division KSB1 bacterium]|nr:hypothetical protein [candidate division KSB1 bacterium]
LIVTIEASGHRPVVRDSFKSSRQERPDYNLKRFRLYDLGFRFSWLQLAPVVHFQCDSGGGCHRHTGFFGLVG